MRVSVKVNLIIDFLMVCSLLTVLFLFFSPNQDGSRDYLYRNCDRGIDGATVQETVPRAELEVENFVAGEKLVPGTVHSPSPEGRAEISGRLTIAETAVRYRCSVAVVKRRLGLPLNVAESEAIGRLRRIYGFTMPEARERLEAIR